MKEHISFTRYVYPRRCLLRFNLLFSKSPFIRRRFPTVIFHDFRHRAPLALPIITLRHCTTTGKEKMSSDETYTSFLEQANQPTTSKKASTVTTTQSSLSQKKSSSLSTKAVDTQIPPALQSVKDAYYTSETDEPWETVSLKWEGGNMPSESTSIHFLFPSPPKNPCLGLQILLLHITSRVRC